MSHKNSRRGGSHRSGNPANLAAARFDNDLRAGRTDGPLGLAGSCIVCGAGTDTGLGFRGDLEWLAAGLQTLGVPSDEVERTLGYGGASGAIKALGNDQFETTYRVCASCVSLAKPNFPAPVLIVNGAEIPCVNQTVGAR